MEGSTCVCVCVCLCVQVTGSIAECSAAAQQRAQATTRAWAEAISQVREAAARAGARRRRGPRVVRACYSSSHMVAFFMVSGCLVGSLRTQAQHVEAALVQQRRGLRAAMADVAAGEHLGTGWPDEVVRPGETEGCLVVQACPDRGAFPCGVLCGEHSLLCGVNHRDSMPTGAARLEQQQAAAAAAEDYGTAAALDEQLGELRVRGQALAGEVSADMPGGAQGCVAPSIVPTAHPAYTFGVLLNVLMSQLGCTNMCTSRCRLVRT